MYFLFGPLSFRYVSNDADKLGLTARWYFAYRKIDCEVRTAFSPTQGFPADSNDSGIAGVEVVLQVTIVCAFVGLGHQQRHVFPENFLCVASEHGLRGRIEGLNQAFVIDHDNGVHGRIEQRFPLGNCMRLIVFRLTKHKYDPEYNYA